MFEKGKGVRGGLFVRRSWGGGGVLLISGVLVFWYFSLEDIVFALMG